MRRKEKPLLKVIAVMTLFMILLLVIVGILTGTGDYKQGYRRRGEPDGNVNRWLLEDREMLPEAAEQFSGFDGISFTDADVQDAQAAFFRLTEDKETGILYAYVPAEMNGKPLYVRMHGEESLQIGGSGTDGEKTGILHSGDELPLFEEGEEYAFTILDEEGTSAGTEKVIFLYTENVPSMFINTESGSMDAINGDRHHETGETSTYRIYKTDGTPESSGTCFLRGRGNSTWSKAKKPYNLNLDKDNSLLGMDVCSRFALIANFWDSSQTRQYYAFEAAERLGLAYTPQTRFVNVYLNGKYHSICLLTQRVNVNGGSLQINDLDARNKKLNPGTDTPEAVVQDTDDEGNEAIAYNWPKEPSNPSGGYLIEFENRYEKEDVWFETKTRHMVIKSPQTPSVGEYQYISDYVREAEKVLYAGAEPNDKGETEDDSIDENDGVDPDTGKTVWDYFDMDSWARMYLIQDFFVQSDDEYYSFFFYKKDNDPLLYCGPVWDFDLCLGNMNIGDYYKTSAQTLWLRDGRKRWLHRLGEYPQFMERVAQIYLEELEPIIRDILDNEYDRNVELLEKVTKLNYLRWGKNLDYDERTGLVRTLLKSRVEFMHDYYTDPDSYCRLLFRFDWGDFSYYVKKGESMGFLPTYDYGEKQSSAERDARGFITGWQDTETGELLQAETPIDRDCEFDPVYVP